MSLLPTTPISEDEYPRLVHLRGGGGKGFARGMGVQESDYVTVWFLFLSSISFQMLGGEKSIYNSILWLLPLHFLLILHLNSMNCPVRVDTHNKWPQI